MVSIFPLTWLLCEGKLEITLITVSLLPSYLLNKFVFVTTSFSPSKTYVLGSHTLHLILNKDLDTNNLISLKYLMCLGSLPVIVVWIYISSLFLCCLFKSLKTYLGQFMNLMFLYKHQSTNYNCSHVRQRVHQLICPTSTRCCPMPGDRLRLYLMEQQRQMMLSSLLTYGTPE